MIDDDNTAPKLRFLSVAILGELLEQDSPHATSVFNKEFVGFSFQINTDSWRQHPRNSLVYVLPLLLGSKKGFELNFENFHYWLAGGVYQLRNVTFPAMLIARA